MPQPSENAFKCPRCSRQLGAEKPVRLPDGASYCSSCCESMASDIFEMETGETFTRWIEKHPVLVMKYQPLELTVRRMMFLMTTFAVFAGIVVSVYGLLRPELMRLAGFENAAAVGRGWALFGLGLCSIPFFGLIALHWLRQYIRAAGFEMTLADGVFKLRHGRREEQFKAADITRACIVRPGTVGANEGAMSLSDGRMLTLDTCLSDLHALGVVMDLRFEREFPPSADELAKIRRDKLRKIRGLST